MKPIDYEKYYELNDLAFWRTLCAKDKSKYFLGSLERITHMHSTDTQSALFVADYGSGTGELVDELSSLIAKHPLSVNFLFSQYDISESASNKAKSTEIFPIDSYFNDAPFDVTMCCHVLEHVSDPRLLIFNLLNNSKFLILEIPLELTIFSSISQIKNETGHINFYNPFLIRSLMHASNMLIISEEIYLPSLAVHRASGDKLGLRYLIKKIALAAMGENATLFFSYHYHVVICQRFID